METAQDKKETLGGQILHLKMFWKMRLYLWCHPFKKKNSQAINPKPPNHKFWHIRKLYWWALEKLISSRTDHYLKRDLSQQKCINQSDTSFTSVLWLWQKVHRNYSATIVYIDSKSPKVVQLLSYNTGENTYSFYLTTWERTLYILLSCFATFFRLMKYIKKSVAL